MIYILNNQYAYLDSFHDTWHLEFKVILNCNIIQGKQDTLLVSDRVYVFYVCVLCLPVEKKMKYNNYIFVILSTLCHLWLGFQLWPINLGANSLITRPLSCSAVNELEVSDTQRDREKRVGIVLLNYCHSVADYKSYSQNECMFNGKRSCWMHWHRLYCCSVKYVVTPCKDLEPSAFLQNFLVGN